MEKWRSGEGRKRVGLHHVKEEGWEGWKMIQPCAEATCSDDDHSIGCLGPCYLFLH
jgi:hypothetical protein